MREFEMWTTVSPSFTFIFKHFHSDKKHVLLLIWYTELEAVLKWV